MIRIIKIRIAIVMVGIILIIDVNAPLKVRLTLMVFQMTIISINYRDQTHCHLNRIFHTMVQPQYMSSLPLKDIIENIIQFVLIHRSIYVMKLKQIKLIQPRSSHLLINAGG